MLKRKKIRNRIIQVFFDYYIRKTIHKHKLRIIFVAGSIGKTSTRYLIANLLNYRYRVYSEIENNNAGNPMRASFFGINLPHHRKTFKEWLEIFANINNKAKNFPYDIVVLELAESRYKDLRHFIRMVQADYGVVTGVAPAHLGTSFKHGGMQEVHEGTWSIVKNAKKILYNRDLQYSQSYIELNSSNALSYGSSNASIGITNSKRNPVSGTLQITVEYQKQKLELQTNFISEQTALNLLPAIVIAKDLGITNEEIVQSVQNIFPIPGRMQQLMGKKGSILLDDTYNASPTTISAALETLGSFLELKRIAVLGDMNSLGRHAKLAYKQIAEYIPENCDQLILFCEKSIKYLIPILKKNKIFSQDIKIFKGAQRVGQYLASQNLSNTVILFKGSEKNVYTEEAIKYLIPKSMASRLVRQNQRWMNEKKYYFKQLESEPKEKNITVGALEKVSLPAWGVHDITAKIDTGASVSTLHVLHIKKENKKGIQILNFTIPQSITGFAGQRIKTTDFKITPIVSSNGVIQNRYFIRTSVELRGKRIDNMVITLSDRSQMLTPMLVGNEVLRNGYLVDVSLSPNQPKEKV